MKVEVIVEAMLALYVSARGKNKIEKWLNENPLLYWLDCVLKEPKCHFSLLCPWDLQLDFLAPPFFSLLSLLLLMTFYAHMPLFYLKWSDPNQQFCCNEWSKQNEFSLYKFTEAFRECFTTI